MVFIPRRGRFIVRPERCRPKPPVFQAQTLTRAKTQRAFRCTKLDQGLENHLILLLLLHLLQPTTPIPEGGDAHVNPGLLETCFFQGKENRFAAQVKWRRRWRRRQNAQD